MTVKYWQNFVWEIETLWYQYNVYLVPHPLLLMLMITV